MMRRRKYQAFGESSIRPDFRRLIFVFFACIIAFAAGDEAKPYAQGNLFVVFNAQSGRSSDTHPLRDPELKNLWCQATRDEEARVGVAKARFVQIIPRPPREHSAQLSDEQRVYLNFPDNATVAFAGKYHCEITTVDADFVTGNLFVYLRPVFYTNGTLRLDQIDDDQPFNFSAPSVKVTRGETARLICPAMGYPPPQIQWLKNSVPLEVNDKAKYRQLSNGELHISAADDPDKGLYECIAQNRFPLHIEGENHVFEARIQQKLHITSSLSWLIPLIVILVIIILLFVIIYACAWWKRRQYAHYHVAKREKCLPTTENANMIEETAEDE